MNNTIIATIIVIILLTLYFAIQNSGESYNVSPEILADLRTKQLQPGKRIGQYLFYPYMGYDGFTLQKRLDLFGNHQALMQVCDGLPNCVAFDSSGRLYSKMLPREAWTPMFPNANSGLFVKDYSFDLIS